MNTDLFRYALDHIIKGDFGTIGKGAVRKVESHIPGSVEFITDDKTPSWLISSETKQIYRFTENVYSSVLGKSRLHLDCETDVEAIELPLVSIDHCDNVSIKRIDTNSTGVTDENNIQVDPTYDYPPVIWKTLNIPDESRSIDLQIDIEPTEFHLDSIKHRISMITHSTDEVAATKVGLPAIVPTKHQPPIIMISIDTQRYDCHKELKPLLDELGSDAIIPTEPRTQGTWTPPSHASMFTGTHPGKHGYVGWGKQEGDKRPIDPDLTTIPELLTDCGYKCSGSVSHSRILPEFGFGRGFHRFRHDGMSYSDWVTRASDSKESVNQLMDWIDQDLTSRDHSLFYFLHVFDPHYPYIPPLEFLDAKNVDFSKAKEYRNQMNAARGEDETYLDVYHSEYDVDAPLIEDMNTWYSKSVNYTANQISRLLSYLKQVDLFNESLIIITGDHGEEFGERGFFTHMSLYDDNIRPFMAIKPPRQRSLDVGDEIDTIDFLPTIAELVGREIPDHCDGTAIQTDDNNRPRVTERIYPDWYNVAVEIDNIKGIFTYESNYPDRPDQETIVNGPRLTEYYHLSKVRSDIYQEEDINSDKKDELQSMAEQFMLKDSKKYTADVTAAKPSQETVEQLKNLGYK